MLAVNAAIGRGAVLSPRGQLRVIDAFTTQQRADHPQMVKAVGDGMPS